MLTKIKTPADLNQGLQEFLASIMAIGASSRGNQFDETVREQLRRHLPGARFVSASAWSSQSRHSPFYDHCKKSSTKNFDFTNLSEVVDNGEKLNLMIVDKPNGSQQWPDLLVIFNGIGFPIEVKSGGKDMITWNSGLPKDNSLYIFNCYDKARTTCFLGQRAIDTETRQALNDLAKLASQFNKKVKDWDFYSRKMFNSRQDYFENPNDLRRKSVLEKKIQTITEEFSAQDNHSILDPQSERQASQVNRRLANLRQSISQLESTYQAKRQARKATESSVMEFLGDLSWDNRQRCDFATEADGDSPVLLANSGACSIMASLVTGPSAELDEDNGNVQPEHSSADLFGSSFPRQAPNRMG